MNKQSYKDNLNKTRATYLAARSPSARRINMKTLQQLKMEQDAAANRCAAIITILAATAAFGTAITLVIIKGL